MPRPGGGPDRDVLDALWDLVWAGELTNDTFAPLRALRWSRPGREPRRRPGRLTSLGPPEAAGRWSLVDAAADPAPASARDRTAPRPGAGPARSPRRPDPRGGRGEGDRRWVRRRSTPSCGRSRRPAGSAAATSSTASGRPSSPWPEPSIGCGRSATIVDGGPGRRVHLLAATDPANPYGAALAWPRRSDADRRPFQRAAGAYVVLVDGRGRRSTSSAADDRSSRSRRPTSATDRRSRPSRSLAALVADRRVRELVIAKVDGAADRRVAVAPGAARGGLPAGLSRPRDRS